MHEPKMNQSAVRKATQPMSVPIDKTKSESAQVDDVMKFHAKRGIRMTRAQALKVVRAAK